MRSPIGGGHDLESGRSATEKKMCWECRRSADIAHSLFLFVLLSIFIEIFLNAKFLVLYVFYVINQCFVFFVCARERELVGVREEAEIRRHVT
jgi:hypothetical protein